MNLNLWRDYSKKNNSTAVPSSSPDDVYTNIRLKENCSTLNPVLILTHGTFGANYTYAQWKGRYYFVRDIVSVNNSTFELHLEVDVLGTYRSYINSYGAYVERCESSSQHDINVYDSLLSQSTEIQAVERATTSTSNIFYQEGCYATRLLSDYGLITYLSMVSLVSEVMPPANYTSWNTLFSDPDNIGKLTYNAVNYLVESYWLPLNLAQIMVSDIGEVDRNVRAGYYRKTIDLSDTQHIPFRLYGGKGYWVPNKIKLNKPAQIYSDFRKRSDNWTEYYLFIPMIGEIPFPAKYIDEDVYCKYYLDLFSGNVTAKLIISDNDDNGVIGIYNGNMKVPMMTGSVSPNILGTTGAIINGAGNILSGNMLGSIESAVDVFTNVSQPTPITNGNYGSNKAELSLNNDFIFTAIAHKSKEFSSAKFGRPCCKNLTLGNLSGYVKCSGSSISIPGTDTERDMINAYLNGGFYKE